MTGEEMCVYIRDWIHCLMGGPQLDPLNDIWNMSKTGELWPVYELYWRAKCDREGERMVLDPQTWDYEFVPLDPLTPR